MGYSFGNSIKSGSREHKFRSPDGELVEIYNLAKFCRDNDLTRDCMDAVQNSICKQHKGWTKYIPPEKEE